MEKTEITLGPEEVEAILELFGNDTVILHGRFGAKLDRPAIHIAGQDSLYRDAKGRLRFVENEAPLIGD